MIHIPSDRSIDIFHIVLTYSFYSSLNISKDVLQKSALGILSQCSSRLACIVVYSLINFLLSESVVDLVVAHYVFRSNLELHYLYLHKHCFSCDKCL